MCFQYTIAYCSHFSGSDVLWEHVRRSRKSVMVSVALISLGHTDLFFIDEGTKVNGQYYPDVLLHQQLLPAIRHLSGDFCTFQQDNAPAHRARETVQLLTCETPDFIAPTLGQSTVLTWTRETTTSGRSIAARCMMLRSWNYSWSKSGNISTRCSSIKRSGSGAHVFELEFEHILNRDFSYVWYLYRRTLWQSSVKRQQTWMISERNVDCSRTARMVNVTYSQYFWLSEKYCGNIRCCMATCMWSSVTR